MKTSRARYAELLKIYLSPQRVRVAAMAVLLLSSIGLQLLNPQLIRTFVDRAAEGEELNLLIGIAVVFLVVALATQATSIAATYLSELVGWAATNALRSDLVRHCLRLDMPFHNARTPGELIERVDGDVTALAKFFSQLIIRVIGSGLLLLGVLVVLFLEDWRVGLALSLFALCSLLVLNRIRNIAVPAMSAERGAFAGLFGFLEERLNGLDDIRANGGGSYALKRLYQTTRDVFAKSRKAILFGGSIWMISMGMFAVGYALALGLGIWLFNAGSVTLGTVFLFFQYTELLRQPLEQISDQLKEFQKATASIERITGLLAIERVIPDGQGADLGHGALEVAFESVWFSYEQRTTTDDEQSTPSNGSALPPVPNAVLRDVSFRLAPGRVLGLLGRTGSGKTTITRLLFRLYDISAGAIRLNGVDIRNAKLEHLRQRIGIVTQDVQLFQASIRDNLTMFDSSIPDERIVEVLEDLDLLPWLNAQPGGLDGELAPGGGLSAGEAQLLAFARVFLRDPGLVIMDEASSRLDPATERRIERAVDKLLQGRTAIIIAHRLGTVQRADEILILEQGRIREYGSRKQLVDDTNSRFAELLRTGMEEVLT